MDFSPEALKNRWAELNTIREGLEDARVALWDELATIVDGSFDGTLSEAQDREAVLREDIREIQESMFPIEQERAVISRALNGKTG